MGTRIVGTSAGALAYLAHEALEALESGETTYLAAALIARRLESELRKRGLEVVTGSVQSRLLEAYRLFLELSQSPDPTCPGRRAA